MASSQNNLNVRAIDSLSNMEFKELSNQFYNNVGDPPKAKMYANAYFKKAKRANDTLKMADGFFFLNYMNKEASGLKYADSIISYTKTKQNIYYPAIAYFFKAEYYYKIRDFKESLNLFLLAVKATNKNENEALSYIIKNRIGLIKSRYGEDKQALKIFKEVYGHHKASGYLKDDSTIYFVSLFALADSYLRNNHLDSASVYNKIGYKESMGKKDTLFINLFSFEEGLVEFERKKYQVAIDSISKTLSILHQYDDIPNIAFGNHYLGKAYEKLNNTSESISSFKKVDSIFMKTGDLHPDLRGSYESLILHYKNNDNIVKQLEYVEKLLKLDSTLNSNYREVKPQMYKRYDTPLLMREKDHLISSLNKSLASSNMQKIALLILSLCIVLSLLYMQHKKRKYFKKQFEQLISDSTKKVDTKEVVKSQATSINISKDVIDKILDDLTKFENNVKFKKPNITVGKLAKEINTNSRYLSNVVNTYKGESFANYVNFLRIDYAIEKLKKDKIYRQYTIKVIAEDVGFSNTQSFSKAFYKKTGIYPSYFINQLLKGE